MLQCYNCYILIDSSLLPPTPVNRWWNPSLVLWRNRDLRFGSSCRAKSEVFLLRVRSSMFQIVLFQCFKVFTMLCAVRMLCTRYKAMFVIWGGQTHVLTILRFCFSTLLTSLHITWKAPQVFLFEIWCLRVKYNFFALIKLLLLSMLGFRILQNSCNPIRAVAYNSPIVYAHIVCKNPRSSKQVQSWIVSSKLMFPNRIIKFDRTDVTVPATYLSLSQL